MEKKRIIIKLSGSAIERDEGFIDVEYINLFSHFVFSLAKDWKIAITVGGGNRARSYINAGRDLGLPDSRASLLGGDFGLIHSRLLIGGLSQVGLKSPTIPLKSWDLAMQYMLMDSIPVLFGRWPSLTSDSVAVYFADYAGLNLILKLSCIDAIYNKDPKIYNDAQPFRNISQNQLEIMAEKNDDRLSGSNFVIDLIAARRLFNSNLPLLLLHKNRLDYALRVLRNIEDLENLTEGTLVGEFTKN